MATVYTLENCIDVEPTPVDKCWECDIYVPAGQRLCAVALYQAILCAQCECWARSVLSEEEHR